MPCIVVTRKIQCRGHLNFAFHKVSLECPKKSHHWSIKKVKVSFFKIGFRSNLEIQSFFHHGSNTREEKTMHPYWA